MSLPKNSSSIINQIEIAALIVFGKNSKIEKGEILEKDGNEILKREPSFIKMPPTKVYVNCYYYDSKEKVIKLIDDLF